MSVRILIRCVRERFDSSVLIKSGKMIRIKRQHFRRRFWSWFLLSSPSGKAKLKELFVCLLILFEAYVMAGGGV